MSTKFSECHKKYKALRAAHEAAGEDGNIIDQLIEEITELKERVEKLENQSLVNQLAFWQQIAKQRQEEIEFQKTIIQALAEENENSKNDLQLYAPMRVISPPLMADDEIITEWESQVEQQGGHVVASKIGEELCMVGFVLAIRYGLEPDQVALWGLDKEVVPYAGTFGDFKRETMPRLEALVLRAPIVEDVRSGDDGYPRDISKEEIAEACKRLTEFRYIDAAQTLYQEALDNQFRIHVKPKVDEYLQQENIRDPNKKSKYESRQRKLFRECIDATFEEGEKKGRGKLGVKPVLKRGPFKRSS
jgi:hypothetical protein